MPISDEWRYVPVPYIRSCDVPRISYMSNKILENWKRDKLSAIVSLHFYKKTEIYDISFLLAKFSRYDEAREAEKIAQDLSCILDCTRNVNSTIEWVFFFIRHWTRSETKCMIVMMCPMMTPTTTKRYPTEIPTTTNLRRHWFVIIAQWSECLLSDEQLYDF